MASFAPKERGTYQASVFRSDEKQIKGSPFKIDVGDKEFAHAAKVQVTGNTTNANANTHNSIMIDTNGAGKNYFWHSGVQIFK